MSEANQSQEENAPISSNVCNSDTPKDSGAAARGYSGGLSSIKRILHDIFNN